MDFEACTCGSGGKNTGITTCVPVIGRIAFPIFVQTTDADGNTNSIKSSDFVNGILPESFIDGKINEVDPSKRWYPTPKINTVTDVRAEANTFDVDGIAVIVDQGVRTFAGSYYAKKGSPKFAGVINSFQCIDTSYFEVTVEGAIAGIVNGTELLPIAIESGTLNAIVVKKTKTDPNSVAITFAVEELVRDENLMQISAAQIEGNMLLKKGLLDVLGSEDTSVSNTATTVRINLTYCYGDFNNLNAFKGAVSADFSPDGGITTDALFNVTQSANISISSVTEVSDGVYDLVLAAGAVSNDVISVDIFKTGNDMKAFTYVVN